MDNLYNNIGWTEDAAVLAAAVTEIHKTARIQYAWCDKKTFCPRV